MNNELTRAELRASRRRPWSRKKKALLFAGIPMGVVATTAAAAAIFAALAGIQGGGSNGDFTAKWSQGQVTTVLDASALTVKPQSDATITNGVINLPAGLVIYPGESFVLEAAVQSGSATQAGYVSGVVMPGLPTGYTAEVIDGCAAKVTNALTYAKVKVTAPATQTAGAAWTLGAGSGLRVTPLASSSYTVPGGVACSVFTAP